MFTLSNLKYIACALVVIICISLAMDKPGGLWPIAKDIANLSYQAGAKLGLIETGPNKELRDLLSEYIGNHLNKRSNQQTINKILSLLKLHPELLQENIDNRGSLLAVLAYSSEYESWVDVYMPLVEQLFKSNIPLHVNFKTNGGLTALIMASSYGNTRMMQLLLDRGADINLQDDQGTTALMAAAANGRVDAVRLLVSIFIKQPENTSYLQILPRVLREMIQNYLRADPNIKDKNGNTALSLAIKQIEEILAGNPPYGAQPLSVYEEIINILEPITAKDKSIENEQP